MKKFVFGLAALLCVVSCFAEGESAVTKRYGVVDKTLYGTKWEREVNNLYKRAEYYKNKAAEETNSEISQVYMQCSDAKQQMAEGYNTVYSVNQKMINLFDSSDELKNAVTQNDLDDCVFGKRKGVRYSSYLKRLQVFSEFCINNAKKADAAGKGELAKQYDEAATYMKMKYEGLKLAVDASKKFKAARKNLKVVSKRNNA